MATLTELETVYSETLGSVTTLAGTDFTSANPIAVTPVTVASSATAKTVTAGTINAIVINPFGNVDFSTVTTADEITDESLNRTARTLRDDINSKMSAFGTSITNAVNTFRTDSATAIGTLTTDINLKLAAIKEEQDTQVSSINSTITDLATQLNSDITAVKTAETQQSIDIATKINQVAGELMANIIKAKATADDAQAKLAALNSVYATDGEAAAAVTNINDLIGTLRATDIDFITAIDSTIDEVNGLRRVFSKEVTCTASSGVYPFATVTEGAGEFLTIVDYTCEAEVVGNYRARCAVEDKTKDGFNIRIHSNGVHFVPQPIDCAVTPVKVLVTLTHNKRNPMTFNVDTLNSAFITDGATTDVNAVGAMVLDTSTVTVAVAGSEVVNALGSVGTIVAVSNDTGIATVSVSGTVVTISGVALGSTTVAVSDSTTVRTLIVTVA